MLAFRIITAFLALATLGLPRGNDALAHATTTGTVSSYVLAHVHTERGLNVDHNHEMAEQGNTSGDPTSLCQLRIDHDRDAFYVTASSKAPLPATPSVDHASHFVAAATFWGEPIARELALSRIRRTESTPAASVRSRSSILLQTSILMI